MLNEDGYEVDNPDEDGNERPADYDEHFHGTPERKTYLVIREATVRPALVSAFREFLRPWTGFAALRPITPANTNHQLRVEIGRAQENLRQRFAVLAAKSKLLKPLISTINCRPAGCYSRLNNGRKMIYTCQRALCPWCTWRRLEEAYRTLESWDRPYYQYAYGEATIPVLGSDDSVLRTMLQKARSRTSDMIGACRPSRGLFWLSILPLQRELTPAEKDCPPDPAITWSWHIRLLYMRSSKRPPTAFDPAPLCPTAKWTTLTGSWVPAAATAFLPALTSFLNPPRPKTLTQWREASILLEAQLRITRGLPALTVYEGSATARPGRRKPTAPASLAATVGSQTNPGTEGLKSILDPSSAAVPPEPSTVNVNLSPVLVA